MKNLYFSALSLLGVGVHFLTKDSSSIRIFTGLKGLYTRTFVQLQGIRIQRAPREPTKGTYQENLSREPTKEIDQDIYQDIFVH